MLKNEGDIYIYIKEDKEIKTNTEKKKTFTTSLTAEEMQLIRLVHQLTRHLCNCHYCQLVYEPPSTIEV